MVLIEEKRFIPGLILSERYCLDIAAPLLKRYGPNLIYSASLIGYGSDVLGFDNPTSMDHNWGPRMQIFVQGGDAQRIADIDRFLRENLPGEFMGFSTHFSEKGADGTQRMQPWAGGPVNHLIEIYDLDVYLNEIFHKDLMCLKSLDWLSVPEQRLLELTAGRVFHDGLAKLNPLREQLRYYPREVQLVKLAAYWNWIDNEEAFVGRMTEMDDLIGAKLIATRIVKTLMKICFMIRGQYAPYSKWFSHAFAGLELPEASRLALTVLTATTPVEVESALAELYLEVVRLQNNCGRFSRVENTISDYYARPYKVIKAGGIVEQLLAEVTEDVLRGLDLRLVGIDSKLDGLDFTSGDTILNRLW